MKEHLRRRQDDGRVRARRDKSVTQQQLLTSYQVSSEAAYTHTQIHICWSHDQLIGDQDKDAQDRRTSAYMRDATCWHAHTLSSRLSWAVSLLSLYHFCIDAACLEGGSLRLPPDRESDILRARWLPRGSAWSIGVADSTFQLPCSAASSSRNNQGG